MCEGRHHGGECGCGHHGGVGHHEMECGCAGEGHGHYHGHHGSCGCGGVGGGFHRRFRGRQELIAELETYLKELEAEAQGVRETLTDLKGAQ